MTEPSVYVEDVSKLKDADEIKQAYVGLKDTNRYFITASRPLTPFYLFCPLTRPQCNYGVCLSVACIRVCMCCEPLSVLCRSPRFMRKPPEVSDLLSRLR